jgi:hypothetical protein
LYKVNVGVAFSPKYKKKKNSWFRNSTFSGEDAFYIEENKKIFSLGIADGVGNKFSK